MPPAASLQHKIDDRSARVAIIGQGYVGLPLAVAFARAGFHVTGIDADRDRIAMLNRGESYIPDVSGAHLQAILDEGRFCATADVSVLAGHDIVILCVPTPLRKSKEPDISYVMSAADDLARRLVPGQLIVLESTTYPGTTEEMLLPLFEEGGLKVGVDFYLAFSPERIDPGNGVYKVSDIPKLVGGVTAECTRLAAALYREIVAKVFEVASPRVAELAKLYENTFRSVNIALANELAIICRHLGVSVWDVVDAAATKPFGFLPFFPGPGIGGHCIPIDPFYLSWKARLHGYEAKFIGLADDINRAMPHYVLGLVTDALNERTKAVKGSRITVLGVAYKRDVGDVRESPALEIIDALIDKGARVQYADPFVPAVTIRGRTFESVKIDRDVLQTADAVLILTDHTEFDYPSIVANSRLIIDTRNATRGLSDSSDNIVRL